MSWAARWRRLMLVPLIKWRPVPFLPFPPFTIATFSLMSVGRSQASPWNQFITSPGTPRAPGTQSWTGLPCILVLDGWSYWSRSQWMKAIANSSCDCKPFPDHDQVPCPVSTAGSRTDCQSQLLSQWVLSCIYSRTQLMPEHDGGPSAGSVQQNMGLHQASSWRAPGVLAKTEMGLHCSLRLFLYHPPSYHVSFPGVTSSPQYRVCFYFFQPVHCPLGNLSSGDPS